jgi:tripartite-type tricarboxylate transporter receptor subunit TctC
LQHHQPLSRRRYLAFTAATVLSATGVAARAQPDWPNRPIKIIVPSAAGGAADFTARAFARYAEQSLKQPVVVENKPGAGTIIGAEAVKNAAADGYTFLLSGSSTQAANPSVFVKLPYDPAKDFEEIGLFGVFPMVCLVKPGSRLKSVADIIEQARSSKLSYGYYSSSSQIPPELMRERTGIQLIAAPYKNITQIITDLAGGVIDFAFPDALSAAPALRGLLTPIAVTSPERYPQLPNVPTVAETIPGFEMQSWLGLSARAGTPPAVVKHMGDLVRAATADASVRDALMNQGMAVRQSSPQEQAAFVAADRKRWAEYVRIAKIKPQ